MLWLGTTLCGASEHNVYVLNQQSTNRIHHQTTPIKAIMIKTRSLIKFGRTALFNETKQDTHEDVAPRKLTFCSITLKYVSIKYTKRAP